MEAFIELVEMPIRCLDLPVGKARCSFLLRNDTALDLSEAIEKHRINLYIHIYMSSKLLQLTWGCGTYRAFFWHRKEQNPFFVKVCFEVALQVWV